MTENLITNFVLAYLRLREELVADQAPEEMYEVDKCLCRMYNRRNINEVITLDLTEQI